MKFVNVKVKYTLRTRKIQFFELFKNDMFLKIYLLPKILQLQFVHQPGVIR